ncbi:MAG TPA: hypothetical protein VFF77_04085 [Holophagaceae bacterium]|jgi:hypothetical protein|nr:hypothetical protein [Holophagaceae bacterium]
MTLKKLHLDKETISVLGGIGGGGGFTVGLCYTRDFRCTDKDTDLCTAPSAFTCVMASCEIKCIPQSTFCQAHI